MPVRNWRQKGLRVSNSTFYWSFSSDIVAVKGFIFLLLMINLTRHWVAGPIQRWPCQVELTWWECQEWGRCPWWVMLQAWAACPWWGVLAWGACPWWGACLWWGLPQAQGFQATPTPLSSWHGCSRCTPSTWLSTCSSKYQCSEILVCGVLLSYVVHLHTGPGVQKLDLLSHRFVRWLECVTCFPDLLFTCCFPDQSVHIVVYMFFLTCCLLVSLTSLLILLFTCSPDLFTCFPDIVSLTCVHIVVYLFPWPVCSYCCLHVPWPVFILLFTCFTDLSVHIVYMFSPTCIHIVVYMFHWPVCSYCCLHVPWPVCSYCCLLRSLTCLFISLFTCSLTCVHIVYLFHWPVCSYCLHVSLTCVHIVYMFPCLSVHIVVVLSVHIIVYLFPQHVCMLLFTCFPDLCVNISNHCLLISLTCVLLRIVAYTFPWHVCSNCCL